ncbi:hypothetical protein [Flavobacterium sp.]|uniref:hypothetical protein n=1 Tax=Flavobacterium sp. TaxID=239 RepID=UPI003A91C620
MNLTRFVFLFLTLLLLSCKKENQNPLHSIEVVDLNPNGDPIADFIEDHSREKSFGEAVNLSSFKNTTFFTTPSDSLPEHKNAIYCPTLLMAWEQIAKTFDKPLVVGNDYPELKKLNSYKDYKGCLTENEYQTAVQVIVNTFEIKAAARFTKQLPFSERMEVYREPFLFNNENVEAFYTWGGHDENRIDIVDYNSDNDFMVRLNPEDNSHEILLWMPQEKPLSLQEGIGHVIETVKTRSTFEPAADKAWRYKFSEDDRLVIPKIYFNLKSNCPDLADNRFTLKGQPEEYRVKEAYQRISFQLDEEGAVVESEAIVAVDSIMPVKPKKMFLNKPFMVLLKRRDSESPYLAVWIENTELLIKN